MLALELILLGAALLLLLSIFASKASGRLGVPALLIFLAIGMLTGSEGPGGIHFDDFVLAQWIGVVALAYILFAGGLDTDWEEVRPLFPQALALATAGVAGTAILVGWFTHAVLGFSMLEGFLLGAIVSSTDAAAVFAVLRSRGVQLGRRVKSVLELESGSNDPMAVFLTLSAILLISRPEATMGSIVADFFQQMTIGAVSGFTIGWLGVVLINRVRLEYEGLYPVLTLSLVLLIYGLTAVIGGNGFLAVYLAGVIMGRKPFIHKRSLIRFHDGVAWLMQITMFLALGLLVFPSRLVTVAWIGLLIAMFLMLFGRPMAVMLTLAPFRMPLREKVFISWVGLRGAVPIILATFPLIAGVPRAGVIFDIVFFIVLTSVLFQGTTIPFVAKILGITTDEDQMPGELARRGESDLITVAVSENSPAARRRVVELGLPKDTLILLVNRDRGFLVPVGSTRIEPGDRLMVFTSKRSVDRVRAMIGGD
ncbi:MAG TPA: potassium/proton antiporter [Thermoanaerobaculia bacterium]|nr:potassium/proton antiporter [Thermoanaerobaculia bacterium]